MSKEKKPSVWDAFLASLSPASREKLTAEKVEALPVEKPRPPEDDGIIVFELFRNALSPSSREKLDERAVGEPTDNEEVDATVARYCIVEGPDGGWPMARLFKTPQAMAKRVCELEGTDTVVWMFFGLPIYLTKGPQRYLLLPGGEKAVMVPLIQGGSCKIVAADLIEDMEIQDDGFVGPPALANTKVMETDLEPAKTDDDDDDDDDDDLPDEAHVK
jgi:hypothetical protein